MIDCVSFESVFIFVVIGVDFSTAKQVVFVVVIDAVFSTAKNCFFAFGNTGQEIATDSATSAVAYLYLFCYVGLQQ